MLSDRVAVMSEGRITGVLDRKDCSEESIMHLAVGGEVNTMATTQTSNSSSAVAPAPRAAISTGLAALMARSRKELGIFCLLLCVLVAVKNHNFLGAENLSNMARLIGLFGIFSLGLGVVIITNGIDLSVGSVFALEGVLLAMMLTEWHWPALLAVLASLALTMLLGLIHGLLITRVPLQPFIVTLCGLLFYRGLARFIPGDETKGSATEPAFRD